ncbi:recombination protein O N-terminal domain-containing protein [Candidatus Kaiserbacteria bacterium]|nr:recombination protein O N-terminal domain-containing protein [Candidatus Kaiserbacteria bacterium]
MAYQTYTTDALVIGSADHLTADRWIALFTRDAGLVHARAISVRKEQSKLRYGLQDFSLARVSLVRGKSGWRIIGAERAHNLYFATPDREVRAAMLRIVRFLRRLVQGEETNVPLYDMLIDGLVVLASSPGDEIVRVERVLTLRVLSALGYVAPHSDYRHMLSVPSLGEALSVTGKETEEQSIQSAIDEALAVSQL